MDNTLYKDQITNQTLDNVIATLISEENHEGVFNVWSNHNEYVVKYTSEYKDDVEFYMVDKNGDYLFSIDTTPEQERILRNEVGAA